MNIVSLTINGTNILASDSASEVSREFELPPEYKIGIDKNGSEAVYSKNGVYPCRFHEDGEGNMILVDGGNQIILSECFPIELKNGDIDLASRFGHLAALVDLETELECLDTKLVYVVQDDSAAPPTVAKLPTTKYNTMTDLFGEVKLPTFGTYRDALEYAIKTTKNRLEQMQSKKEVGV